MVNDPANKSFGTPLDMAAHVFRLLSADWEKDEGPLRLNGDLPLSALDASPFFQNARLLLRLAGESGGAPLTQAGNLSRAFVGRAFESMRLPPLVRESIKRYNKVINETDVFDLHLARVVCELGGLLAKRGKTMKVTKRGHELLADDAAGRLFRALFIAYFRKFNLSYAFPLRDVPGIQRTLPLVLWALDGQLGDWKRVAELPGLALPLPVLAELKATMHPSDTEAWIFSGYVLEPLFDFGLIEHRKSGVWPAINDTDEVRLTPLWASFLRFDAAL